ncbi:hypothetical protein [Crenothrix polyspora]|uniref:hypothetical protein n=1 Tax=Crenothrix polyspora TaxID=360316 RepID=UPI001122630B|nr:hypothetical protein [Crenothrix polyspora]
MRHRKTEQTLVVFVKQNIPTVLVVLVTGTDLEQEHRQAGGQVGGQFIVGGFFRAIIHIPHPAKQVRKVLLDGLVHFIYKLYFLLLLAGNGLCFGQGFA